MIPRPLAARRMSFIQVSQYFDLLETQERELRALASAVMEQKGVTSRLVITESDKHTLNRDGVEIEVVPLYEWLLN